MDELELRIARLELGPGDMIILQADKILSREQADRIREYVRLAVGNDRRVLLLSGGIELSVLTKTEIDARAA